MGVLECQLGLPDAAQPVQGLHDQRRLPGPQPPPQFGQHVLATGEVPVAGGDVPDAVAARAAPSPVGGRRPQPREVRGQAVDVQLVEGGRAGEVLEPVPAQAAQGQAGRQVLAEEGRDRLRQDDLVAGGGRGDPGRLVHGQSHVAAGDDGGLAAVQTHAHVHAQRVRPRVRGEGSLGVGRGRHRLSSGREGHEEGIALGVHLVAVVGGERVPQQALVRRQHRRVGLRVPAQELGGTLDVGEEEGDRPAGQGRVGGPVGRHVGPLVGHVPGLLSPRVGLLGRSARDPAAAGASG
jgi:hypothetical protein